MSWTVSLIQSPEVWHREGLFTGMHWAWWMLWIVTLLVVAWAFVRLFLDRRLSERWKLERQTAEDILRERFARGEIEQEELVDRLRALQDQPLGTGT